MTEHPQPPAPTQEWTAESVRPGKVYDRNEHGKILQAFYVDFKGADGFKAKGTYWKREEGNSPEIGKPANGTISVGDYGYRFKLEKMGGPRQSGGGSKSWQSEQERDPERSARILRQHSQEMAIRAWFAYAQGDYGAPSDTKGALKEWTDFFDADVNKAGQAAVQAHGNATESASSPTSASRGSEQPPAEQLQKAQPHVPGGATVTTASPNDEDEQRLDDALYNAGINDFDERRWLTQAWKGLPLDRQKKSLGVLIAGDIETPPKTLKGLQEIAGPMPESFRQPEEDIPF